MPPRRPIHVVAAAIRDSEGRVLITQRPPGGHLALTWEFPGGKTEAGEGDAAALRRELREELGIDAEIGALIASVTHRYEAFDVALSLYEARIVSGHPTPLEVHALRWVPIAELTDHEMPPADVPLVAALAAGPSVSSTKR